MRRYFEVDYLQDMSVHASLETFSLFGKPLYRQAPTAEALAKQETLYGEALERYRLNPDDVDAIVWLGRRTAYLGRFSESASIFSTAIEKHPLSPKPYRHRGHRFITLRRFDLAAEDLQRAAELIADQPDEMEPPGTPNEKNIGASSLHFNVWYHLGLAQYLRGKYWNAVQAYRACMKVSETDEKRVATSHWFYMALRRVGREIEAGRLLEPIRPEMEVGENRHYHECLLMYKGLTAAEELYERAKKMDGTGFVTIGYGVGNWYSYSGQREKALEVLAEIQASSTWSGFGYIAAESDLKQFQRMVF